MTAFQKQPERRRMILLVIGWIVFLAVFLLLLNLPWSPLYKSLGGDSGLYAYIGKAILHGQLPYRDVWEHKPPVGFYLNSLAILLFGQTPWALWWFNLVWLVLTVGVFFLIAKKLTGALAAGIASLIFSLAVMAPDIFQGGNLLEIYALLPQVLILGAACQYFSTRHNRWIFLLGLLTGLAFLTKQTTLALGFTSMLAIWVYGLFTKKVVDWVAQLGIFLGGAVLPVALTMFLWMGVGAFGDFMDAVFFHSLAYAQTGGFSIKSLLSTLGIALLDFPLGVLYNLAIAAAVVFFVVNYQRFISDRKVFKAWIDGIPAGEAAMLGVFLAMPLEILIASAGGRNQGHYFLTCVPAVAMAFAYLVHQVIISLRKDRGTVFKTGIWTATALALLAFISFGWLVQAAKDEAPTVEQLASVPKIFERPFQMDDLGKYVIKNTTSDDTVLVWHIHVGFNFIFDRRSPTPYLYPLNLFVPVGDTYNLFDRFLADLKASPPELILVQKVSSIGLPFVNVPLDQLCADGCQPEVIAALKNPGFYQGMEKLQQFFETHYSFKTQVYDWLIYQRTH